jgi:uncharacterized sporulation protein YeaH/YhbH (DUF444 family)
MSLEQWIDALEKVLPPHSSMHRWRDENVVEREDAEVTSRPVRGLQRAKTQLQKRISNGNSKRSAEDSVQKRPTNTSGGGRAEGRHVAAGSNGGCCAASLVVAQAAPRTLERACFGELACTAVLQYYMQSLSGDEKGEKVATR